MSAPDFKTLLETVPNRPWFVGRKHTYQGYRAAILPDADGHGWDVAHICNGEDADSIAQLIARCNPATMRVVWEALELSRDALDRIGGSPGSRAATAEEAVWNAIRTLNGTTPTDKKDE